MENYRITSRRSLKAHISELMWGLVEVNFLEDVQETMALPQKKTEFNWLYFSSSTNSSVQLIQN